MPNITCIWNPGSLRAKRFTEAMKKFDDSTPEVIPWIDVPKDWQLPSPRPIVRIDSPGKNWEVEKTLLHQGLLVEDQDDRKGVNWTRLTTEEIAVMEEDKGRVLASRQWYVGFREMLSWIEMLSLGGIGGRVRWMQNPRDIVVMFDKALCHPRFVNAGCHPPHALGVPLGFGDLMERMERHQLRRVFLKLCHGSSASGAVALEMSGNRMQAFSTARIRRSGQTVRLYNDRKVQRYSSTAEVRELVDAVCRERAWAEAWVPKAGWQGRRFDVRVVVIKGRARHVVARLADGPFTNLQLGGHRASAVELREHIGHAAFTAMCEEAERAMSCFPNSLHGGVDVLLEPVSHRAHVLEVNAFGDLLPDCLHEGRDTYAWELEEMCEG